MVDLLAHSLSNDLERLGQSPSVSGTFSFSKLAAFAGPGLLMAIAYIDPGNLEGDLQTGAQTQYSLLWVMLWSTVVGGIVQMQAAKLGVATSKNLAEVCRLEYTPLPRYVLWLMTEVAIVGSDMQEVIGGAIAIHLLSGQAVPLWGGVLTTAVSAFGLLLLERAGARKLELLFALCTGVMAVTFGWLYVRVDVDQAAVAEGVLLPKLQMSNLGVATALVGALIMPHNLFLHSALVHTRRIESSDAVKRDALFYFGIESSVALAGTVFINLFVISVFAHGFYDPQHPATDIGLTTAGQYLGDKYGGHVTMIWAVGLLAAGYSASMTGTYTGQFVMSGFLDLQSVSPALRICMTRAVALVPTLAVTLLVDNPTSLDTLNQGLNLLQAVQLPFALLPLISLSGDKVVMGSFANGPRMQALLYTIAAVLLAINFTTLVEAIGGVFAHGGVGLGSLAIVAFMAYCCFIPFLAVGPRRATAAMRRFWGEAAAMGGAGGDASRPLLTDAAEEQPARSDGAL